MVIADPEQERVRLAALYSGMEDGELAKLAEDPGTLTDLAHTALASEMGRRGSPFDDTPRGTDEPEFRDLVTIGKFQELLDASLAKGSLESAGIDAFLADTYTIGHVAPVELQVQRSDVEAAKEILDAPIPESFEVDGEGKFEQPRCPQCGSIDVSSDDAANDGLVPATPAVAWKCQACQEVWPVGPAA